MKGIKLVIATKEKVFEIDITDNKEDTLMNLQETAINIINNKEGFTKFGSPENLPIVIIPHAEVKHVRIEEIK